MQALPPFATLRLGAEAGCWPLPLRVVEGADFALNVTAQARRATRRRARPQLT